MINQEIRKNLQEELEDKIFIQQADKLVDMLFKSAELYTSAGGNKELLFLISADIETYLKQTFTGSYKQRIEELIQQEEGKKETTELKLKGEEQ